MFGLIVLIVVGLYFGLMYLVMRWAWRKGRVNGGSVRRGVLFAALGFLAVYLPVFWSYIPVLIKHRVMCAKDAGFTVYVPKEQWVAQHQDTINKLSKETVSQQEKNSKQTIKNGFNRRIFFGGMLAWEWQGSSHKILNRTISRYETRIRDAQTDQMMAVYIDYSTKNWYPDNPIGWIFPGSCFMVKRDEHPRIKYLDYLVRPEQFRLQPPTGRFSSGAAISTAMTACKASCHRAQ